MGTIIGVILVALLTVYLVFSVTKNSYYKKGYINGIECIDKAPEKFIYDINNIVHKGISPLGGIDIYEKEHPYDEKSDIPEFGLNIQYTPNDDVPLARKFNIVAYCRYTIQKLYNIIITPEGVSDGYHTFEELYYYRMLYNSNAVNLLVYIKKYAPSALADFDVIKSKKHFDGKPCYGGGWFIVVIKTPWGQISNHYKLEHWDMFNCRATKTAWKWDNHTMKESTERMIKLNKYLANIIH